MSGACKVNCSSHPTEIQAYGDIAGIGVTLAFIINAWMVVCLLILYYLAAYNPELDPFRKENEKTPCRYPNAIDFTILRLTRQIPGLRYIQESNLIQSNLLESALNNCVITLSDIQIFTGISILISGYITLHCGLSAYHWQLMVYLAWLASITHLATLSFLRNYLTNRPIKRLWRLFFMSLIMVLLAVAVGLTAHFEWKNGLQEPANFAVCYFRMPLDTRTVAFESMVKMILLIVYGFSIRVAKMSRSFERGLREIGARLRTKSTNQERGQGPNLLAWDPRDGQGFKRLKIIILDPFLIAFYSLINIQLDLFTSFLAEVYWLTFVLIWGTKRLFHTREKLGPGEENEWTFGQTLPLVLLIAPLAAIIEHVSFSTKSREREDRSQSCPDAFSPSRLEIEDVRDNAMISLDRDYVDSISYQGAIWLVALAYIEAGLFFVVDDLRGISKPFQTFAFTFFVFNSTIQIFWLVCTLWISRMHWIIPLRRSANAITLLILTVTSMAEFFISPPKDFESNSLQIAGYTLRDLLITYIIIVTTFAVNSWLGDSSGRALKLLAALLPQPMVFYAMKIQGIQELSAIESMGPCLLAFGISLVWFFIEWYIEKTRLALTRATCIRCVLFSCILIPIIISYYVKISPRAYMVDAQLFMKWIIILYCGLVSLGLLLSLYTPVLVVDST